MQVRGSFFHTSRSLSLVRNSLPGSKSDHGSVAWLWSVSSPSRLHGLLSHYWVCISVTREEEEEEEEGFRMGGSRQKGRGVLANLRLSPTVMHLSLVSLFKEKKRSSPCCGTSKVEASKTAQDRGRWRHAPYASSFVSTKRKQGFRCWIKTNRIPSHRPAWYTSECFTPLHQASSPHKHTHKNTLSLKSASLNQGGLLHNKLTFQKGWCQMIETKRKKNAFPYFPSSSNSWYSSVNLVQIVNAILKEVPRAVRRRG